ncbi:MAG: hypothetical protein WBE26_19685 [Phycisphaerae bacterium]
MGIHRRIMRSLRDLPGPPRREVPSDGRAVARRICMPHSLRAATATHPADTGVDMSKVQDLPGNRQVTTTQTYGKRRTAV